MIVKLIFYINGLTKFIFMKNYIILLISAFLFSCGGPQGIIISEEDKATFERNYKAFEKHHLGGIINNDMDLFLELYSDTLKWSGPNNYDDTYQTKADLAAAAEQYRNTLGAEVGDPVDEEDHGVTVIFIELPNGIFKN